MSKFPKERGGVGRWGWPRRGAVGREEESAGRGKERRCVFPEVRKHTVRNAGEETLGALWISP